jgi:hypothetical protein
MIFDYLIDEKVYSKIEALKILSGVPHVYLIQDPEPIGTPIFGYGVLSNQKTRYVGFSSAKGHLREKYSRRQVLLTSWFKHLHSRGFGTTTTPIRKIIILSKRGVPFTNVAEALSAERDIGNRLGLAKFGGQLLNQVEPGGDTYGGGPSEDGKRRLSEFRRSFKISDETRKKQSLAGLERATRERTNGLLDERSNKISRGRRGIKVKNFKSHPNSEQMKNKQGAGARGRSLGYVMTVPEYIQEKSTILSRYFESGLTPQEFSKQHHQTLKYNRDSLVNQLKKWTKL